jgi:hypothetical protein
MVVVVVTRIRGSGQISRKEGVESRTKGVVVIFDIIPVKM